MSRRFAVLFTAAISCGMHHVIAAEPLPPPAPSAPAAPAAVNLVTHQYFYVEFPHRLRALRHEITLAEAELAVAYNRADSYRPFRSFGRYAATYMADQSAQLAVVAAVQRLECLRDDEAALWRERRLRALELSPR